MTRPWFQVAACGDREFCSLILRAGEQPAIDTIQRWSIYGHSGHSINGIEYGSVIHAEGGLSWNRCFHTV